MPGDCLFVGGCGKFFEGTGADMQNSLFEKLAALPHDTKVYCGHEYTLSNYRFALSVDPDNEALRHANSIAEEKRREGKPTVPSTIDIELRTNPFFRVTQLTCFPAAMPSDRARLLDEMRTAKNNFK